MTGADHGAAASALGYLYQFEWALIEALEAYPTLAGRRLSIEKLDDIGWETDGGAPVSLSQLKHHGPGAGALTDMHDDVWSTVSVWLDAGPPADPEGPELKLVTTQVAQPGSAMEALRPGPDGSPPGPAQVAAAADRLERAAGSSQLKSTARTRERFGRLTRVERVALLTRVRVLDGSLPMEGLRQRLDQAIGQAMPRVGQDLFVEQLHGWWSTAVLHMLGGATVRVDDVHDQVGSLRDQYTPQSLPTTVTEDHVRRHLPAGASRRFVKQLEWVGHRPSYIELAVLDYYRAYEQRVAWGTVDLIGLDELARFEDRLRESWARRFEETIAELPEDATDTQKQAVGRALLAAVMNDSSISVREHYREPFFARGTRHFLADSADANSAIGWHPEFRRHLTALLVPVIAGTA